jgi:tetratricopeptide (TPR) repeat protein
LTPRQTKIFKRFSITLLVFISVAFLLLLVKNYYIFRLHNSINESKIQGCIFQKKQQLRQEYNNRVSELFDKADYQAAMKVSNEYAISDPDQAEFAFFDIGQIYLAKGNKDSAIYYFTKAINKSGHFVYALVNRAWTYYDIGEYKKAELDLLKATSYRSDYFYDLGVIQEKFDKEKAIKSYNLFISENKDSLFCVQRRDSLLLTMKSL